MKRFGLLLILMFLVSACGQAPTPTATPDVPSTAAAIANTMVAGTLTAMPTATKAPTATPQPTATAAPTETPAPTEAPTADPGAVATALPAATQVVGPQATPTMFFGTTTAGDTNNLTDAYLLIQNLSGEKVVYVTLTCHTSKGAVITYNVSVTKTAVVKYVVGSYAVLVQIPNKRYLSISYAQTNKDKSTLSIYLTKLAVHGP